MVRLAIRDDDVNFFTKVNDLDSIYKQFNGFPISYAVIPYVTDVLGGCPDTKGNNIPKDIANNNELIEWLKCKLNNGTCDVLLHGIQHGYVVEDGILKAEMLWRDKEPFLENKIRLEKNRLSSLLGYQIACFVAPSNKITKYCLKAVERSGLHFSGIVPLRFNESFTLRNICNYFHRWLFRAIIKLPYPGIYNYSGHQEINACLLLSYEYLVNMFNYCDRHNLPMVINVHYWSLRDHPNELEKLRSFVMDYAIPHGAKPSKLSDLFAK